MVFITSRSEAVKESTEALLKENGVGFDQIIYNAPYGERILINDRKPSGLRMSYSFDTQRDEWCGLAVTEDEGL